MMQVLTQCQSAGSEVYCCGLPVLIGQTLKPLFYCAHGCRLLVALCWASFSLCITPLETEKCSTVRAPSSLLYHLQWSAIQGWQLQGVLSPCVGHTRV